MSYKQAQFYKVSTHLKGTIIERGRQRGGEIDLPPSGSHMLRLFQAEAKSLPRGGRGQTFEPFSVAPPSTLEGAQVGNQDSNQGSYGILTF